MTNETDLELAPWGITSCPYCNEARERQRCIDENMARGVLPACASGPRSDASKEEKNRFNAWTQGQSKVTQAAELVERLTQAANLPLSQGGDEMRITATAKAEARERIEASKRANAQKAWECYIMEEAIPADVCGEAYDRIVRQLRHAFVTGYLTDHFTSPNQSQSQEPK